MATEKDNTPPDFHFWPLEPPPVKKPRKPRRLKLNNLSCELCSRSLDKPLLSEVLATGQIPRLCPSCHRLAAPVRLEWATIGQDFDRWVADPRHTLAKVPVKRPSVLAGSHEIDYYLVRWPVPPLLLFVHTYCYRAPQLWTAEATRAELCRLAR